MPVIYSSSIFRCNNHCKQGLKFLLNNQFVPPCIRKLTIRCNSALWGRKCDMRLVNESRFVEKPEKLAPELLNLDTFVWQGKQMPQRDNIWIKMPQPASPRDHCSPSQGGHAEPEILANSEVFGFRQLVSFAIVIHVSYEGFLIRQTPHVYSLPMMFWEFLRQNTNLEELSIDTYTPDYLSTSESLTDIVPLFDLHFPKLRKLVLGSFTQIVSVWTQTVFPHLPIPMAEEKETQFLQFLSKHGSLESFYSSSRHRASPPWPLLPNLTELRCRNSSIKLLNNPVNLKSLELLPQGRLLFYDSYSPECLPNLTKLTTWIKGSYQVISRFREYHPNLRHLDISSQEEISLAAFSALSLPENLTMLQVSTPHRNNRMKAQAVLIFRHAPSLQKLTLRYMALNVNRYPNLRFVRVGKFQLERIPGDRFVTACEVAMAKKGERKSKRYRTRVVPRA
ncbi:hypothetical protein C8J56DRAFT_1061989 [Mycena floridula]|nr:hypothetical protein C8J56DRAFT_1061989 [Mycena floridula]